MGSPANEEGRASRETQHKVTLTKGFYMGVHLVTQKQCQAVMGNNPSFRTPFASFFNATHPAGSYPNVARRRQPESGAYWPVLLSTGSIRPAVFNSFVA